MERTLIRGASFFARRNDLMREFPRKTAALIAAIRFLTSQGVFDTLYVDAESNVQRKLFYVRIWI